MINKHCKECPHIIRNRNNDIIVKFSKDKKRKHNCHMSDGKINLWDVKEEYECFGSKSKF